MADNTAHSIISSGYKTAELLSTRQKEEALKRIKAIGLTDLVAETFKKGIILKSTRNAGELTRLNMGELQMVRSFEVANSAKVWHIITSENDRGIVWYDLLFVSKHTEDWPGDMEDLTTDIEEGNPNREVMSYNYNGLNNEFGYIWIKKAAGEGNVGLIRTE